MKLSRTNIAKLFSNMLYIKGDIDIDPCHYEKILDINLRAVSLFLTRVCKNDDSGVQFIYRHNNEFLIGARASSSALSGLRIIWSYNEDDINLNDKDDIYTIDNLNDEWLDEFKAFGYYKYDLKFDMDKFITLNNYVFISLKQWLDKHAKKEKETVVELNDVYEVAVMIDENDKIVYDIRYNHSRFGYI